MLPKGEPDLPDFEIIRFDPSNILMRRRTDRKVYRYVENEPNVRQQGLEDPGPRHQGIVSPIRVPTGLLYPQGINCLSDFLSNGVIK